MVDPSLMRGEDWVRCCICGELHQEPFEDLVTDIDGVRWDVCRGDCADEAGIIWLASEQESIVVCEHCSRPLRADGDRWRHIGDGAVFCHGGQTASPAPIRKEDG